MCASRLLPVDAPPPGPAVCVYIAVDIHRSVTVYIGGRRPFFDYTISLVYYSLLLYSLYPCTQSVAVAEAVAVEAEKRM